ncbi:aminoglycoside phosphotransferase family protein [Catenulispora rubra]|uniref:aminoglycoside phosphotransferase family protein n=1 Tax=Catenulispora rubra TaxID=280293 RepID=UPI002B278DFC|nr:aminoglycoside phosphotransferase family protein [Catenulispora rubra]
MDEVLSGGITNAGAVVRRGEIVDRPAQAHAAAIHRFLEALPEHGFSGAPQPVGLRGGREQLTFVSGEVALLPYPAWSMTDAALRSVGVLLRRFREASSAIPLEPGVRWATDWADPRGGTVLCHSDVCVENVVFRDGEAYGLIDFDMAAPGRPLWDVAMAARYWVPMLDPETAARFPSYVGLDSVRRLRILADGYGMSAEDRTQLLSVVEEVVVLERADYAARVKAGDAAFVKAFHDHGGWAACDRLQAWLADQSATFLAALIQ